MSVKGIIVVDKCMQTKKSKNHEYLVSFAIIEINLICNWLAYISVNKLKIYLVACLNKNKG